MVLAPSSTPQTETTSIGEEVTTTRHVFRSQEDQCRYLRSVVDAYRGSAGIRQRARDIVFRLFGCEARDKRAHALAIARWVQLEITYVNEFPEVFQTPETTLAEGYGDCDDHAVLVACLLESVGVPVYLFSIGWNDPPAPRYEHIYPVADLGPLGMLPIDTTLTTDVSKEQRDPLAEVVRRTGRSPRVFVA